jgi:hypothetical protein
VGGQGLDVDGAKPAGTHDVRQAFGIVGIGLVDLHRQRGFGCRASMQTTGNPLPICTRPRVLIKGKRT